MNRDEFIQHVKTHGDKETVANKVLINTMEVIQSYFSSIFDELKDDEDLKPYTFTTGSSGNLSEVSASYKEREIRFLRKESFITIRLGPQYSEGEVIDTLFIDTDGLVKSQKHDEAFSQDLLEKYLPLLVIV